MAESLDVYRDWLGIRESDRPLTHYQLLRVPRFCDDAGRIRENYRKMNAHVRKFATGDYSRQSQALLNELARAMLTLTDVARKREYDAGLGRGEGEEGRRRTLEELLLARKVIDQTQLNKARTYAEAVGLEIRDALVQQKVASPPVVMQAYAESVGLPYVELADLGIAEDLVPKVPPAIGRTHSCVPIMVDEGQVLVAAPHLLAPEVEDELRLRFDMPVRTVLCTASSINAVVEKCYPRETAAGLATAARGGGDAATSQTVDRSGVGNQPMAQAGKAAALGFAAAGVLSGLGFIFLRGGLDLMAQTDFLLVFLLALAGGAVAFFLTRRQNA